MINIGIWFNICILYVLFALANQTFLPLWAAGRFSVSAEGVRCKDHDDGARYSTIVLKAASYPVKL